MHDHWNSLFIKLGPTISHFTQLLNKLQSADTGHIPIANHDINTGIKEGQTLFATGSFKHLCSFISGCGLKMFGHNPTGNSGIVDNEDFQVSEPSFLNYLNSIQII